MSTASAILGCFALASFVLLLAVLLWPSRKRKDAIRSNVPASRWPPRDL